MKKSKIEIGTEIFFYHPVYGFFSDKISIIDGTKAILENWPPFVRQDEKTYVYEKYKISINAIEQHPRKEKQALVKFFPHGGVSNDDFMRREIVFFSLNKKEILGIHLQILESNRETLQRTFDTTREIYLAAIDDLGKLETEQTRVKNLISEL
jgi:hypothetical protein